MAKFLCVCGHQMQMSGPIPNPIQWNLVWDEDLETFIDLINADHSIRYVELMFRCPVSDHLWVYWDGMVNPPTLYAPQALPPGWS